MVLYCALVLWLLMKSRLVFINNIKYFMEVLGSILIFICSYYAF